MRTPVILLGASLLASSLNGPVSAFNYVVDANGTWWGIQDAAPPRVDTGSIRATQIAPGIMPDGFTTQPYSTAINGFGGIKVRVETSTPPRFNGELMRGFGLQFDGTDRFTTTRSIDLGGVLISRSIYVNRRANWARWLDSFTNTTKRPLTINVAFGGQSGVGIGASGTNNQPGSVINTSSGDAIVTAADAWVTVASPLSGIGVAPPFNDPYVTLLGTPSTPAQPFSGAMTLAGNWLYDTFESPLVYTGHEGNFQAYINTMTIAPRATRSLLHFVVLGPRVTESTAASVQTSMEATANALAEAPDTKGLTTTEGCSIANFTRNALAAGGVRTESCREDTRVAQADAPNAVKAVTSARYDVVGKTIARLRADMEAGRTTSQEITRAYLDRIAVYDQGQFGLNAYEYVVARQAMAQAQAADAARRAGRRGPLLGIPIAVKNLFDTHDMPTTNGSMTFKGFLPARDAFQVARLRDAGAVIVGKTALEEYATTGGYSNDAWGQVWNVFNPSKSAIASSGGSAVAVAASMAAAALGSQTGDSLYGPASAASLVTLRGTDGLQSGAGVMPLVWLTDFGGAMTRSVSDLADMLNVLAAVDPDDPETSAPGRQTPADWRAVLDVNALRGKRIGFVPSAWVDPLGTTATVDASKAALKYFVEAGATIVEMGVTVGGTDLPPAPAAPPGDVRSEGWRQYIDKHPELLPQGFKIFTAVDVNCSQKKVAYVRADPTSPGCQSAAASPRMTAAEIQAFRGYRRGRQATAKAWMDSAGADHLGVDAVVYPGLLSDISLNDGGGSKASFGRRDTPSAANGIPTVVFPAGYNNHGAPIDLQLLGRAWDDDKLVAMAYAFEQRANAAGNGHVEPGTVPPLKYRH
jgi:amidase